MQLNSGLWKHQDLKRLYLNPWHAGELVHPLQTECVLTFSLALAAVRILVFEKV